MDGREKLRKGYKNNVHRRGQSNVYDVELFPRGFQQFRGVNNQPGQVPPGFNGTVDLNTDEPSVSWRRPPQDVEVTLDEFNAEAIRLAREKHQQAAA